MDILRDLGFLVRIHTNQKDGVTELLYEASTDGRKWKPFEVFIKEDVDVSQHELVRKNVVTATRYSLLICYFINFFNLNLFV